MVEFFVELFVKMVEVAVVHDEIIGDGNRAAFFDVFNFSPVALVDFLGCERADRAVGHAGFAQVLRRNDRNDGQLARKFVLQHFVFRPGVQTVGHDAALAGVDKIVDLPDDALHDEVLALFGAQFLADWLLVRLGHFQAAAFHFVEDDAAEIHFRIIFFSEVIYRGAFPAAGQADKCNNLDIFMAFHSFYYTRLAGWYTLKYMHNSDEVLDGRRIGKIQEDLKRFADEWKRDHGVRTPGPVEVFCDLLLRGGKRLRGLLAMQSYYAHGGTSDEVALGAARVFEIIQASLLAVDDIADRSELRRGGPAVHMALARYAKENGLKIDPAHYGETQAMNVAYAGLHKATTELLELPVPAEAARRASVRFHENILTTINGQIDDIYNECTPGEVSEADVMGVLEKKTPHYTIIGPLELGAQLAGKELPENLREFGMQAGCAFQIADDIIGTFGRESETGKGSNDDIREGKLTLLSYYALAHGTETQVKILRSVLGNESATLAECDAVRNIFVATGALDYTKKRLEFHDKKALAALENDSETQPEFIRYLRELADYLVDRRT